MAMARPAPEDRIVIRHRRQLRAWLRSMTRHGEWELSNLSPGPRVLRKGHHSNGWLDRPIPRVAFDLLVARKGRPEMHEVVVWDRWRVRGTRARRWFRPGLAERGTWVRTWRTQALVIGFDDQFICAEEWTLERIGHELRTTPPKPSAHDCSYVVPDPDSWTTVRLQTFVRDAIGLEVTWADDEGRPVSAEEATRCFSPELYVWPVRNLRSPEYVRPSLIPLGTGEALLGFSTLTEPFRKRLERALQTIPGVRVRTGNCTLSLTEWRRFLRTGRYVPDGEAEPDDAEQTLATVIQLGR